MKVHFVVHEAFESPGAYETWVEERGYEASYSRVYEAHAFPDVDDIDLLVVLGGPQSPATTQEECPHFDAAAECALIANAVTAQKAVVGVCLGAQLLGFQCHMEFTLDVVERLIAASESELATSIGRRFVQQSADLRGNDYGQMNRKLFGFLDKLVAQYPLRQD